MLVPLLICLQAGQLQEKVYPSTYLSDPISKQKTSLLMQMPDKIDVPKASPKKFGDPAKPFLFDWLTVGYGFIDGRGWPRFRVFSQERSGQGTDRALMVTRMLQRLWEFNYNALKQDHAMVFGGGLVQVFMCFGGKAGGEQIFEEADDTQPPSKQNDIYLYDLDSFTSPVEMAREVAHEYGHAFLPPVGGYSEPEDWADGYLGEKLYLRHVEQMMEAGRLDADDAMGATMPMLKAWVTANVNPLVARAAVNGPNLSALKSRTKQGMDEFLGLALYVDTILPDSVFSRAMQLIGSTNAEDFPDAAVLAAEEPAKYTLKIPDYLANKAIWMPLGKCKIFGATVVRKNGDWAMIRPTGVVTIVPRHDG